MRLDKVVVDEEIERADLNNLEQLEKSDLEYALCRFICEVRKVKDDGEYPGRTLYQMICSIQNFLRKNDVNWRLVHRDEFIQFQRVLDMVMQERAAKVIGTVKKQAQVISLEYENQLWAKGLLGEDTPDKLRDTVLYLLGVNLALRAGDKHHALRRLGGCVPSQLIFEINHCNLRCLVYREDTVTKTNKGDCVI